jgi:predicted AlkP superfamily phosphohydrolase/phosphomutase
MTRVMMVGIDGLDADLLRIYGPSLPHLRLLMLESPFLELQRPYPFQVETAWASLYNAETFWNIAEQVGKRACVLVSSFSKASPMWSMRRTCAELQAYTLQQAEQALEFLQRESWDIFFWQTDTLHFIQQCLWLYDTPEALAYPKGNKHISRLLNFYHLFDTLIGQLREVIEKESVFVVVSGYGQRWYEPSRAYLSEWLYTQRMLPIPTKLKQLVRPRSSQRVTEGVFLVGNLPPDVTIVEGEREPGVLDVAPTVLALLGISDGEGMEGSRVHGEARVLPIFTPVSMPVP